MKNLLAGNWEEVGKSTEQIRKSVSGSIAGYTQWQLEKGLKSMNFVERS
jgi:DNA repair protein RecO (recombination protein O)